MEYKSFHIKNFKGISDQTINLGKRPDGRVFTLVGLNESGKTTVLEAISSLESREKHLEALYQEDFRHGDAHDLIPMKKKANFNESVEITAEISLSDSDVEKFVTYARRSLGFKIEHKALPSVIHMKKEIKFENSLYKGTTFQWDVDLTGIPSRGKKEKRLSVHDIERWRQLAGEISDNLPSILYFPTFLFDFPKRIYVSPGAEESEKNAYYYEVIKDILDSLGDNLDVNEHIVDRARKGSSPARTALEAVLARMSSTVSKTVFKMWNNIFEKNIPRRDIVIRYNTEPTGNDEPPKVYLEFSIKDGDEIYLITERSLGFRWFFCFMLFTQFRQYRREKKNTLFLFDEPASNLHSRAQAQLLQSFTTIIGGGQGKILYSTHSHYMINPKWLENIYIVSNGSLYDDDESMYEYSSRDTDIEVTPYREFVSHNPAKVNYFQPILDTLEHAPSSLENISNAVFVEGKNDFYMIKYFNEIILGNQETFSVIPGTGAGGFDTLIRLYLGWGKKFILLLDDDEAGRRNRDEYIREWDPQGFLVLTLGDISEDWRGLGMDKLLSEADVENIRAKFCPYQKGRPSKKEICRALQEKLSHEDASNISKETIDSFRKLMDQLKERLNRLQ